VTRLCAACEKGRRTPLRGVCKVKAHAASRCVRG
jgi:hypothetical protein